jgi:hypothetical protein
MMPIQPGDPGSGTTTLQFNSQNKLQYPLTRDLCFHTPGGVRVPPAVGQHPAGEELPRARARPPSRLRASARPPHHRRPALPAEPAGAGEAGHDGGPGRFRTHRHCHQVGRHRCRVEVGTVGYCPVSILFRDKNITIRDQDQ